MIKSCYIHIPFCNTICSYCDFCKQFYNKKKVKEYLEYLEEEIKSTYKKEELDTIYIGGGTPSCLDLEELEQLFTITDSLKKSKNYEFTIEGNFSSTTKEKLELYKKHGVNRLSLGIESINKENQKFLERNEDKDEIIEKIKLMRDLGFSNINVDLIYALPQETMEVLKEDLDFITSLKVEHISTYSLIIEEHTKLKIKKVKNIEEELDEQMYFYISKYLTTKGYNHYEISNFSKEGYESRHNNCYWNNEEYYGFGLGASSYIGNIRKTNTRSLEEYKNQKEIEKETLTEEDKIEYEVLLNLRLSKGINLIAFEEKYHKKLEDIYPYQNLIKENLLIEEKNHLRIPEDRWYVSNEIIVKLLENKIEL